LLSARTKKGLQYKINHHYKIYNIMTTATFTIGNLTIENSYPQIDIVENFYASATERKTLFIVIAVSKGVYTFISAGENMTAEQNNVLDGICTNGTFSSKQAAAEAAFNFAVEMATKVENDFASGYPEAAIPVAIKTENAVAPIAAQNNTVAPIAVSAACKFAPTKTSQSYKGLSKINKPKIIFSSYNKISSKMDLTKLTAGIEKSKTPDQLQTAKDAVISAQKSETALLQNELLKIQNKIGSINSAAKNLLELCELQMHGLTPMPTIEDEK